MLLYMFHLIPGANHYGPSSNEITGIGFHYIVNAGTLNVFVTLSC